MPQGAAAPMMLGGASVAVYALVVMWSIPSFGIIMGSLIAWLSSIVFWSIPAFIILKKYRDSSID